VGNLAKESPEKLPALRSNLGQSPSDLGFQLVEKLMLNDISGMRAVEKTFLVQK
jgi:hypothetical protein